MKITYLVDDCEEITVKPRIDNRLLGVLLIPAVIFFLELCTRLFCFGFTFGKAIIYILLFSLSLGLLLSGVVMLFKRRNLLIGLFLSVLILYYGFNIVYYSIFHTFFSWSTVFMAADVTDFYREAIAGVIDASLQIIVIFIPLVLFILYRKKVELFERFSKPHILNFVCAAAAAVLILSLLLPVEA
ncbi:MAG TPA: hypothetical protein PLI19_02825, partial [Erysipelotrichaceae bacterium]|nr:hypothetical protein [Erysipelotrichaceae bacterium]